MGNDKDILRKCDRRMLRFMAKVKWQDGVSSEEVARRCGFGDILERARKGRLQWFGHVRREGEEGVLRKVGSVGSERHEKDGTKRGAVNGSKKLIKGLPIEKDCRQK